MKPFYFKGELPASKSILNRLLILQSYEPKLNILGDSDCDDVVEMKHALAELGSTYREPIDCGAAGTTFRFFALRASRVPGEHRLTGSPRLFARPQEELVQILRQLGVNAHFEHRVLVIQSRGWDKPKTPLKIDRSKSSQFASSVLLNSWGLSFDLEIEYTGVQPEGAISEGYLEITEKLVSSLGMRLQRTDDKVLIPARSEIRPQTIRAEVDTSSAFAVAALAAIAGEAVIENFPHESEQPDAIFPEILKNMGAHVERVGSDLRVARVGTLKPIEWNLRNSPDLFPVLATLCAFADGVSRLHGAPQLIHKESSRIESTEKLIVALRRGFDAKVDGAIIHGRRPTDYPFPEPFTFNPDEDHRLAMAAGVAIAAGFKVRVLYPMVVNKSFPGFWNVLEKPETPVRTLIIGHRGTGKTAFLDRVREYYSRNSKTVIAIDLDFEIAKREAKSISDIFQTKGEAAFRQLEVDMLLQLVRTTQNEASDVFIALGAGFTGEVPPGFEVLWLRRESDRKGRIFLNRPRLNANVSPLDEYLERYNDREDRYKELATSVLTLSEGFDFPNVAEEEAVLGNLNEVGGAITLLPEDFRSQKKLFEKVNRGHAVYELRDDLLSQEQFEIALTVLPAEKILLSARKPERTKSTIEIFRTRPGTFLDWATELGPVPANVPARILSIHSRRETIQQTFGKASNFETKDVLLKLAVEIKNFKELQEGHRWWQEKPETRIFLPSSPDGRWNWYRLWQKPNLSLNFVRDGEGTSPDQPLLLDWVRAWPGTKFAAVVGNPVSHSHTPGEHFEFFSKRSAPVFAVQIDETEWNEAMEFLQELGLHWVAVTAPLKDLAYKLAKEKSEIAKQTASVNTLIWNDEWQGTNTDQGGMEAALISLQHILPDLHQRNIAIWGGGGTLNAVQGLLPNAIPFSARSKQAKEQQNEGKVLANWQPDLVVWAVNRTRWLEGNLEFPDWQPKVIWDLNYTEDSPGREFAQKTGAIYVSGEGMFKAQAKLQRDFWEAHDS